MVRKALASIGLEAVDRSSPIPFYLQVIDTLQDKIESGEWKPDQRLPSEVELCDLFNVSRAVIRQALNEMVYEGLLVREQGKGTFVARPKMEHLPSTLISFSRQLKSQGYKVRTRVIDQEIIPATAKVARHLEIEPGAEVVYLRRLRMAEGTPVALHSAYLPADAFAELVDMDLTGSLWDAIQKVSGLDAASTRDVIEATLIRSEEAALFGCPPGRPALLMSGVACDAQGRPFRYTVGLYRSEYIHFSVEGGLVNITMEGQ